MPTLLSGVAASSGIAIAKAYRLDEPMLIVEKRLIERSDEEIARFQQGVRKSKQELEAIRETAQQQMGGNQAVIFDAHLFILDDRDFLMTIVNKIKTEHMNAEFALQETVHLFVQMFEKSENVVIRERVIDIYDVKNRLLAHLLGVHLPELHLIAEDVIVIAKELTPSDTVQLNPQFVKGFVTERGATYSHSAIIARSLNMPAVMGIKETLASIEHGDLIVIDGFRGQVHVNPTSEVVHVYEREQAKRESAQKKWHHYVDQPTMTKDGYQVAVAANIVSTQEVEHVQLHGAEGVGLFRTEFLFMGREEMPSEEEQFETYKAILIEMKGKPVIIRTLDIGGDKALSYLNLPFENNPFLGYRAIRYSLQEPMPFEIQLRALLRASVFGQVKIMFPMIATLSELRAAKHIVAKIKQALVAVGTRVCEVVEVGMMVEVPVVALMADQFAKEVDFFSIGTNDLIQYMMAADRMNEQVAYLYQPHNPAIFRLIKMVIDAAHQEGKSVSLCGEMAGDKLAIPILLGLGLDEFSVNTTSILQVRSYIHQLSHTEVSDMAQKVLQMGTAEDVEAFVQQSLVLH